MGQVVEHDHQVRLQEGRQRRTDWVGRRQMDGGLEGRYGVVGQHAHRAADEARHVRQRRDTAAAAGSARRAVSGSAAGDDLGVKLGRVFDAHRPAADDRLAVAHLEQPARQHAQERVATEALAAFDRLEQVGRACRRRGRGRRRSASRGRRRAWRAAARCRASAASLRASASESGSSMSVATMASRIRNDPSSSWDERSCLPRCHPGFGCCRTLRYRRDGLTVRLALPCIAGALRRSLLGRSSAPFGPEAPGSIHSRRHPGSHHPPGLCAGYRALLVPIIAHVFG